MKTIATSERLASDEQEFPGEGSGAYVLEHLPEDVSADVREFLSKAHGHLIDGRWVDGGTGEHIPVSGPATGQVIARVASGGKEEIDQAVAAARKAFETGPWATMVPVERARILFRLADLIEQHSEQLSQLESLDTGMSRTMMRDIGIKLAADQTRYYAGWVTKLNGEAITNSRTRGPGRDFLTYTVKEPVGVVGQIVPWNFPLGITVQKLAPALAAGCTIVLKPAEEAPLSVNYLANLASEAGLPDGVLNLVNGIGTKAGAALAAHPGVDKVAFTGSTDVGREIIRAAAGNLKRVSLELGGKSPVVLLADANLDEAIPAVARAITFLSGQNCMAGSRLLVHEDIHDEVLDGLAKTMESMSIGPGFEGKHDIGPLISERQMTRVLAYIDIGLGEGARLITGGQRKTDMPGTFVEPTIFADCNSDMRIVREEIFGPILTVQKFASNDLDEIAALANEGIYGLSASVWTRDVGRGHQLAGKIQSGQVGINVHAAVDPATPFGGFKQSGWGRESGSDGLEPYLETKAITAHL